MRILFVTPFYPFPAEKTGGVHTINYLISSMQGHIVDIFYYGEEQVQEYIFSESIQSVYYDDMRKKSKMLRIKSIVDRKTYSSYMFKSESRVLNSIVTKVHYDLIVFDQYSSMKMGAQISGNKMMFMHDSLPLFFGRKKEKGNLISRVYYAMQYKYALNEEDLYYKEFKKIVYVSTKDIDEEKQLHPYYSDRYMLCDLGVDIEVADKSSAITLPENSIVFTGVMDYEPNVDAMRYFVNCIFTKVQQLMPDAKLYIVGKNPVKEVLELGSKNANIIVTGRVDNVFSYIKGATVYVSPLRLGSGKKNKVIESIACQTPTIASDVSMDGFESAIIESVIIPKNDDEWVNSIVRVLRDKTLQVRMKDNMKGLLGESYKWNTISKHLLSSFENSI